MYRGYKINIDETFFSKTEEADDFLDEMNDYDILEGFLPLHDDDNSSEDGFEHYKSVGESLFRDVVNQADDSLLEYISEDGVLEGDVIQDKWFPVVKGQFDVFISHSHKEEDLALAYALSGWLNEKFGLKCFLDEYVWDSADGLIRKLDDLCRRPGETGYKYRDRNMTTSQVHAMLTSAIMQEIDDCDALFFLNTPNTVDVVAGTQEYTLSPWIFLEIGFSKLVKKEWKNEKRKRINDDLIANEAAEKQILLETVIQMRMNLDTSHLTELSDGDFNNWKDVWEAMNSTKDHDGFSEWYEAGKEIDPLIVLDSQHELLPKSLS